MRPWRVNYYDALANTNGGATRLLAMPAQFLPAAAGSNTGTRRQFNRMDFRLFYSNNSTTDGAGNTPGLTSPPAISGVSGVVGGGNVIFSANVLVDSAARVQQVWVTYTVLGSGTWQSVDGADNPLDLALT